MSRAHLLRGMFALVSVAGFALAQEHPKKATDKPAEKPAAKPADPKAADPKPATKPADKAAAAQPSAEDAAMMAKFMAYATPGPEHAMLKPLVGNFQCDVKMTMEPGAPPMTSSATVKREWILGDRYIQEDVQGTFMEMPFQGHGVVGYDNGNKNYFFTWFDNMGTGVMIAKGKANGKVVTFEGENYCPEEGKNIWGKSVMDLSNNDKHSFKMFSKDKTGKEFQNFEMACTRK